MTGPVAEVYDAMGDRPVTPEEAARLLSEARRAWTAKLFAESQLERPSSYRHMSRPMREDHARHTATLRGADATLARILGGRT